MCATTLKVLVNEGLRNEVNKRKWVDLECLEFENNYFEALDGDKPLHPYIDLDGYFEEDDEGEFNDICEDISIALKKLFPNLPIMCRNHYKALKIKKNGEKEIKHKFSYRITDHTKLCRNMKECKYYCENVFQKKLKDECFEDYYNYFGGIDTSVYGTTTQLMSCMSSYKIPQQKDRVWKFLGEKGEIKKTIIQSIIHGDEEIIKIDLPNDIPLKSKAKKNEKSSKGALPLINIQNQNYSSIDPIVILLFEYLGNENISFKDYSKIGLTLKNNKYPFKLFYDWGQLNMEFKDDNKINALMQWEEYHCRYYPIEIIYGIIKANKPDKWIEYKKRFLDTKYFISLEDFNKGETQIIKILLPIMSKEVVYTQKRFFILNKKTQLWEKADNIRYYIGNLIHKFLDHSVCKMADRVNEETNNEEKDKLRKLITQYNKAFKTSSSSGFLSCIEKHCKVALYDKSFYDKLDSKFDIICFKNGLYDLKNNEFRPIYDNDFVSKTLDYDYEPSNEEDKKYVRDALYKICNANQEHLDYYLSILGHSITGRSKVKALYFFFGEKGNNGKTTFLDILGEIFPIYVSKSNRDLVMKKSNDKHKFIASLHGKRIVWIDELTTNKLDTSFLKEYADGRSIEYKVMFGETATLKVTSKLFMITNHTPKYDNDGGMEKRIKLLKFNSEFSENTEEDDYENLRFKGDTELSKKIIKHYKYALIELLFQSANLYYKEGIKPYPQDFQDEKNDITEDNDIFTCWFNQHFEKGEDYRYSKKEMENCLLDFKHMNLKFSDVKDGLGRLGFKYDRGLSCGYAGGKQNKGGWKGFTFQAECLVDI